MKISKLMNEFKPYKVKEGEFKIRLDKNESPFDLPKEMKEELFEVLKEVEFNRYPHITADPLRKRIAEFHNVSMENVIVGNGSDEILSLVLKPFAGDFVVITSPTFVMYEFYSKLNGVKVLDIPLDENFDLPDGIEKKLDGARAIFISSPNNPTGNLMSRDKILKILETETLVILDEAYIEFSSRESMMPLIEKYDNLIILRTLSKAFGLAGLRIGYALSNRKIIEYLLSVKSPFSLDSIAMEVGEFILDRWSFVEERIEFIKNERDRIYEKFKNYAFPSETNFILFNIPCYDFLLKKGVAVRKLSGRLKDMVRITVGNREENDEVMKWIEEFLRI